MKTSSTLSSTNFTQSNTLLKELTQTMNNKIKLHILGVHMNKLGNQLMMHWHHCEEVKQVTVVYYAKREC